MKNSQKRTQTKVLLSIISAFLALTLTSSGAFAQAAGIDWQKLCLEANELHDAGNYDSADVIAKPT